MGAAIAGMTGRGGGDVTVRLGHNFPNAAYDAAVMLAAPRRQRLYRQQTPYESIRGLPLAAQLHTAALNGGSGSDGSTPKE